MHEFVSRAGAKRNDGNDHFGGRYGDNGSAEGWEVMRPSLFVAPTLA